MAKKTKQTKEKRTGAPSQAGVRVAQFFKKNIYVILMIVCILAIATMITVAVVVNNRGEGNEVLKPIEPDDPIIPDNPVITPPDDTQPDDPVVTPPEPDKPDTPVIKDFILSAPLDSYTLGQEFYDTELVFNPTHKYWATHEGVDFMAAAGSDVKCMFDGQVKSVTTDSYYGTVVTISHQDGFESVYKLLDEVTLKEGDSVTQGQVIGKVSDVALAEIASGAHLHLELTKDGKRVNPMEYMLQGDK
ncbi:MAG: peptidoglycan DD-metalloendopeptidase family protein [Clostridia bacterium]|nr:peptidoglycan DD-metalloendopeptidase family protein [Clostridia bacterium]